MKKTALLWIAVLLLVSGCGIFGSDKEDEEQWENGYALIETNDEAFPIIIGHESGMNFAMGYSGDEIDKVVVWEKDREEDVLVFYMDANGLPEKVIADGYIFLFENYDFSENVVDMAMISPDGEISIERGVPIPQVVLEKSFGGTMARLVSIGMDVGVCAVGIKTAKFGVGLALLPSCGSAVLSGIALVTDSDAFKTASAAWSTFQCGATANCAGIKLELIATGFDSAEDFFMGHRERVELARSALQSGFGDVQVTLTWNNTADLDLWVTDPDGERIYFGNRTSASGGQLDRDVISGYGPENIFWPPNEAPPGDYLVQVHHYSGASPSQYSVLIQAFGHVKQYEGTISSNQVVTIAEFTSGQPLPKIVKSEILQFTEYEYDSPKK